MLEPQAISVHQGITQTAFCSVAFFKLLAKASIGLRNASLIAEQLPKPGNA